jgi:transcriptional regulator of acetoin/glycerol metabolism
LHDPGESDRRAEGASFGGPLGGEGRSLQLGERAVLSLLGRAPPPADGSAAAPLAGLGLRSYRELIEDHERLLLRAALEQCGGNVAAAARLLKVDRGNLFRRMKALLGG